MQPGGLKPCWCQSSMPPPGAIVMFTTYDAAGSHVWIQGLTEAKSVGMSVAHVPMEAEDCSGSLGTGVIIFYEQPDLKSSPHNWAALWNAEPSLLTLISFHLTGSISYTILDGRCLRSHPSVFYTSTIKLHRNLYSLTSSEEFEKKLDLCSYLSLIFSPFLPSLLILIHLSSSSLPCSLISLRHHLKTLFPLSVSLIWGLEISQCY